MTPARFLADVDWLALTARALPAPVRPVVAPADPLELSAIEALLLGGAHHMGRASESDDPFVAAAAARHLFDHDFEPCDEEAPGGKPMRFELPKPQAALCGARQAAAAPLSRYRVRFCCAGGARAREGFYLFSCGCGFCSDWGRRAARAACRVQQPVQLYIGRAGTRAP